MDYSAYTGMDASDTEEKITRQRRILSAANVILAVGPKLKESAEAKVAGAGVRVEQVIPGLAEVSGVSPPTRFRAITYGRLEASNDRLKQTSLAVAGFARASAPKYGGLVPDDNITVIGIDSDGRLAHHRELLELAQDEAKRAVQVHAWPYLDDRIKLLDHLRNSSVCLMLSVHEGFGLAGWEAIAAEVPLIVSRNSGLFETIDRLAGGMGTGCLVGVDIRGAVGVPAYRPEDVDTVSNAILEVSKNIGRAKTNAVTLKRLIQRLCTWPSLAETVAAALGFGDTLALSSIQTLSRVGVDRWESRLLLDVLLNSQRNVVDEASKRNRAFANLWDSIAPPSSVISSVILFGGVSSGLCNDEAAGRFSRWLASNSAAELVLCYETGDAAVSRAKALAEEKLPDGDLPTNPIERMEQKERRILTLRERVVANVPAPEADGISRRIRYVPLRCPLTTYIMVLDEQLFITPVFDIRSTNSLTFTLSRESPEFELDVVEYMVHHLARNDEATHGADVLPDVRRLKELLGSLKTAIAGRKS